MKNQLILFISCAIIAIASGQTAQTFTYKTIDNLSLTLDVYVPTASPYTKYPVIFAVHGGAYVEGAKSWGYSPLELTQFLSLGFVAVTIDYRLSPGVLLGDIVEDMQDAYNFVLTELVNNVSINTDAIIVWGRSAGGGLSVISGYMLNPRPKAIIAFYPYCTNFTDPYAYNVSSPLTEVVIAETVLLRKPIIAEFTNTGPADPRNILFLTSLAQGKAGWVLSTTNTTETPENILAYLSNYSAVNHVDSNYPPAYLIHGLSDTLVPFDQSVQLASVLDANNITHVMDLVPGVGHAWDDGVTDPNSSLWHNHLIPVFDFAVSIISKLYDETDMIIS